MTITKFNYIAPNKIEEVLKILENEDSNAAIMAGGTDLLIKIRQGVLKPKLIISLRKIKELSNIEINSTSGLTIGATVSLSTISNHKKIMGLYPTIAKAASFTANPQVRNLGTLIGNICNASPAADNAPILLAMNAFINIISSKGSKKIPLDEFFIAPGKTILAKKELVTSIFIPFPPPQSGTSYLSFAQKSRVGCTTVGVASMLTVNDKIYTNARLFVGACGPTPIRALKCERMLINSNIKDNEIIKKASQEVSKEIQPITDIRASSKYRSQIVTTITARAIEQAKNMALNIKN